MYHLFVVVTMDDVWDEIPYEKREWWFLEKRSADREELVALASRRKSVYTSHKLVRADYTVSDCFYPRAEIKRRTNTAKMLKAVGYGK